MYFKSGKWLSGLLCQSLKFCHFRTEKKDISAKWSQLSFTKLVTFWMQSQRTAAKYKDLYDYVLISMWLYIKPFASWGLLALRQFLKENSSQKGKFLILLEVRYQSRKGDFTCRVSCQAMLCSALGWQNQKQVWFGAALYQKPSGRQLGQCWGMAW